MLHTLKTWITGRDILTNYIHKRMSLEEAQLTIAKRLLAMTAYVIIITLLTFAILP